MADRLNKLSEYLNNQNLQQAIQIYRNSSHLSFNLDDHQRIKLAKANFFISQDYKQTIDILSKVKQIKYIDLHYQVTILQAKAMYMLGEKMQGVIEKLQEVRRKFGSESGENVYYLNNLREVIEMVSYGNKNSNLTSSSIQTDEKRQFQRLLKEEDDNSIISEGMPRFLISQNWLDSWKAYTTNQRMRAEKRHPGPITQFDILDHPFRVFYDSTASKDYTNRYVFPSAKYELVPKKAWTYLKNKYGGIEVKRYNVSFVDKPYEIVTEVHLKKIEIARKMRDRNGQKLDFITVQITKKETWKGLKDKLSKAWGIGEIYEEGASMNIPVNEGEILEEIDTVGKRYFFIEGKAKTQGSTAKAVERCGSKQCGKTENLVFCKCKTIKYCNMDCLKNDYKNHKKRCQLQTTHQKQQSAMFQNFSLELKDYSGRKGRVGLKNLGNTCYMNSGLQCLSNTKEMTQYFMRDDFKNHINYSNPLGAKGNLACAYAELIRQIWTGSNQYVSPFKLKKMIGNFATQFSGFGQQDSQQFISYLIDGLSQDLNLVKNKQTFETSDDIKPDEEMSKQSQINYQRRIMSYVRNLMVGQFKSTVVCSHCKKISVCFDPFLLISLPIPTKDETELFFVPFDFKRGAIKFTIQFNRTTTLKKVTDELVQAYNKKLDYSKEDRDVQRLREDRLIYLQINGDSFEILNYLDGRETIVSLKGKNYVFCLQVPMDVPDHQLYLLQFLYEKGNISFPRFCRLPRKSSTKMKEDIVIQVIQRTTNSKVSYNDFIGGEKLVDDGRFKKIVFECQKKVKLLTYIDSQKQNIRHFMQVEDTALNFDDCLNNFAQQQNLAGDNLWYCGKCKQHKEATRKLQIYKSNKILVIAFKRFNRYQKIRTPIKFPLEGVNFGPYLLSNKSKSPVLYDLYGVVNHYGTMGGGHYTAYCQNFLDQKWYEFNDSRVSQIKRSEVISGDAYVLFFRRRD